MRLAMLSVIEAMLKSITVLLMLGNVGRRHLRCAI